MCDMQASVYTYPRGTLCSFFWRRLILDLTARDPDLQITRTFATGGAWYSAASARSCGTSALRRRSRRPHRSGAGGR